MDTQKLSAPIAFIKGGWQIYKTRFRSLILLILLQTLGALIGVALFVGIFLLAALAWKVSMVLGVVVGVVLSIPVAVALVWFVSWTALSILQIIQSEGSCLLAKDALSVTRSRIWGYVWLGILGLLLCLAGMILIVIGFVLCALVLHLSKVLGVVVGILVTFGAIAISILLGMVLSFAKWIYLIEGTRGWSAIHASKNLIFPRFREVLWRMFAFVFCYVVVQVVVGIIIGLLFFAIGHDVASAINRGVSNTLNIFVLTPLLLSSTYLLYKELKA